MWNVWWDRVLGGSSLFVLSLLLVQLMIGMCDATVNLRGILEETRAMKEENVKLRGAVQVCASSTVFELLHNT